MWIILGKTATILASILLYLWIMRESVRAEIEREDSDPDLFI